MKKVVVIVLALLLWSCHDVEEFTDNPRGNFEQLWTILDEHYCFFREKNVDWDAVHDKYSQRIGNEMTREELFDVCAEMLAELRDGHTNLSAPFNTFYYRAWWSDYPQNYNARIIEQYYFNFNYRSVGGMDYGLLPQNVGYLRYASFAYTVGEGNLDNVLAYLSTASGLIIDVRDNGGGEMTNVESLVARFIDEPVVAGYISHKTGPGHGDFSAPRAYVYKPAPEGSWRWSKPVVVLTNRSTFSAANSFVSVMKQLPHVRVVGATTGGGSGMPYSSELPNGWGVRFSACSVLDAQRRTTEFGVEPSEGCSVALDPQMALQGRDTMLDFAVRLLTE